MKKKTKVILYKLVGVAGMFLGAASFVLMPLVGTEIEDSFMKQAIFSLAACLIFGAGLVLSFVLVSWSRNKMMPHRLNPWQDRIYWPKNQ